jgi:hypothetical protein
MVEALTGATESPPPPAAPEQRHRYGLWIGAALVGVLAIFTLLIVVNRSTPAPVAAAAVSLSRTTAPAGSSLVVTGSSLPANQTGTVQVESRPQQIGAFTADQAGSFSIPVTVPENLSMGDHVISVCWSNSCPLHATLTVVVAPSPSPTPAAKPTGSPTPVPLPTSPVASPSASP